MEEVDVTPDQIDYILITHTHSDHTGALKVFLNKNHPLLFIDEEMIPEINYVEDYDNIEFKFSDFDFEGTKIEMFHTSHDAPASRGYIIREDDKSFVYITDTGYINQKYFKLLENKDIYLFESNHDIEMLNNGPYPKWLKARVLSDTGHLSNIAAGVYLSKFIGNKTKKIILIHLSETNNTPDVALKTVKDTFNEYDIKFNSISCAHQNKISEVIEL
jgi:phosphoribosyl 1,2-cyclic phosphodiesterase